MDLLGIAIAKQKIVELNGGQKITVKEKYPVLNTEETDTIKFWNSLDTNDKIEIGIVALHYNQMSPNYRWHCDSSSSFDTLPKKQQQIIKFCFNKRDDYWFMFDMLGLLKLY